MKDDTKISIVILTYNCQRTIEKCLKSLREQSYPKDKIEIILLDNGSSDNTRSLLKDYGYNYYSLPSLSIPALRNKGLEIAKYEIVGFVDSDCVVDTNWARNSIEIMRKNKASIVGYKYQLPPNPTYFERTWYSLSGQSIGPYELIPAGNMVLDKNFILQIGGFNESIPTGEDSDLLKRVRSQASTVILDPMIINYHYGNAKTLKQFYIKELWYGMGVDFVQAIKVLDRPLILSIFFVSGLLMHIFLLIMNLLKWSLLPLIASIGICFLSSCNRKFYKKRGGNILYITIVYVVYFLARFHSLIYVFKFKEYNNVKNN